MRNGRARSPAVGIALSALFAACALSAPLREPVRGLGAEAPRPDEALEPNVEEADVSAEAEQRPGGPEKPRVLLLGDSISIGYTPFVEELLREEAVVVRPMHDAKRAENCAGTTHGIENVDRWLRIDGGRWDAIHFNFGLHDIKRVHPETGAGSNDPSHPRQASPDAYERQLREIVRKLEATGARLILATTTPVPPGGVRPHRDVEDPKRYNEIARRMAEERGIAVNDLHAFALQRLEKIQQPVNVHFTREGSRALAERVVEHVRKALRKGRAGKDGPGRATPRNPDDPRGSLQGDGAGGEPGEP